MKKKVLTCLSVVLVILALISLVACDTTYNVTIQESEHGSVTADVETIKEGENLTLTIAPDEGYVLDSLSINDAEVAVEGLSYVVENVTSDITVSATFIRLYSVSIAASSNGSVTASASQVVAGGSLTLTINPEDHYQLDKLYINDSPVEVSGNTYVVNNASSDIAVKATFVRCNVVSFNYGLGQGEEATRNIIGSIAIGELPSASIEGGIFLGWYLDGEKIDGTYQVSGDITLNASYLSAEVNLSGKEVLSGLTEGNVNPTVSVRALIDGEENSDIALSLSIDNEEIASINDDNQIVAIGEGEVALIVKYGEIEVARIEGISCRDYSEYIAISNKAGLKAIFNDLTAKYYLTQDIDWDNEFFHDGYWNPLFGKWDPADATKMKSFQGVFDGRGHKILNGLLMDGDCTGISQRIDGVIRDVAFVGFYANPTFCRNASFFGTIGENALIENVYVDYCLKYTRHYSDSNGGAGLASTVTGKIKNVVLNLSVDRDDYLDRIAAVAVTAGAWAGKVENVVVMSNSKPVTSEFYNGLYIQEAASGVAACMTNNVGAFLDTYSLLNSDLDNAWLNEGVWSIRDGAIYFHDTLALEATPEWDVRYNGSKNINKEYGAQLPNAEGLGFSILNNGQVADEFSEDLFTLSSTNEEVAKILYDEDEGFYVEYVGAGSAVLSITVGDTTININVILTQAPEWTIDDISDINEVYAEGLAAINVAVSGKNYLDDLTAIPSIATVESSNAEVATVAIDGLNIVITPVGAGKTFVTIKAGDAEQTFKVVLVDPNAAVDLVYDGGDINVSFESEKVLDIVIKGSLDEEEMEIPESVKMNSTDSDVAELFLDNGVIKVRVKGEGEATLSAQSGERQSVSFKVTATQIFQISTEYDINTKFAAHPDGKFVLTNNISIGNKALNNWNYACETFSGVLDGQGYAISDFTLATGWNGGFFYKLTGTVKNIAFINVKSSFDANAATGVFMSLDNNALLDNVYIDFIFEKNPAGISGDSNYIAAGPVAGCVFPSNFNNIIVNLRFADGLEVDNTQVGAIAGKGCGWSYAKNVKVIVNSDVTLEKAPYDVVENGGVQAGWNVAQYKSLEELLASDCSGYTASVWTINESGIKFGENVVLAATVSEAE